MRVSELMMTKFGSKTIYEEEKTIGFSGSITYLVELITQISKYLTKGRGLSKNGVNSLLLFLLTAGLLYQHTNMPTTLTDKLKLYFVPLIFFSYSAIDLAKNIEKINNFFRRLGQRTDFTYENIMQGNINYEDLKYDLSNLNFTYRQTIDVIKKLTDSEQFTPKLQNYLLRNDAIYRIDTIPLIRDSFINPISISTDQEQGKSDSREAIDNTPINIKWAQSAVCIFLSKMNGNLSKEYLDKLIDKYKECPSVLIAIGYFHRYKNGDYAYFKIGNEFKYKRNRTKISLILFSFSAIIFLIFGFIYSISPDNVKQVYSVYFYGALVLFLSAYIVFIHVVRNDSLWSLKNHLKNYDVIKDDFVASEIIRDLHRLV